MSERAVFLRGGEAYVPAESIGAVVESRYRVHLSQMLAQTARALPRLDEEDRLLPILRALTKMEVGCGFDAGQATDAVTPEMIDQVRTAVSFETFDGGAWNAPPTGVFNTPFFPPRIKSCRKVATNDVRKGWSVMPLGAAIPVVGGRSYGVKHALTRHHQDCSPRQHDTSVVSSGAKIKRPLVMDAV